MKKQEVLELLDQFPSEDLDSDHLMHELYLRIKLERAEAAVDAGQLISHEEAVRRSRQWLE
jgi:hypothetical protein